jgi:hypothetical protein
VWEAYITSPLFALALPSGYSDMRERGEGIIVILAYHITQYSLQKAYNPAMMDKELHLINIQDR